MGNFWEGWNERRAEVHIPLLVLLKLFSFLQKFHFRSYLINSFFSSLLKQTDRNLPYHDILQSFIIFISIYPAYAIDFQLYTLSLIHFHLLNAILQKK